MPQEREDAPERGKNTCKGPEMRTSLAGFGNRRLAAAW